MNVVFFEDHRDQFLPLVYTKPLAKIRVGILSIEDKWKHQLEQFNQVLSISYHTASYLASKYPLKEATENVFINARFLPNEELVGFIVNQLVLGDALVYKGSVVASRCTLVEFKEKSYVIKDDKESLISIELNHITDLFVKNDQALSADFDQLTRGRISAKISSTNTIIGDQVFLEEGAKVEASILNSTTGPIYVGAHAEIMEGCLVRGGLALAEHAVLKMGAKIYGATTIGAFSKVGGEVNNCVIQDYSNKGHDGFLGNSLLGEWCNLGADTNTSNLKNNYGEVKLWSYKKQEMIHSGLQFCGLIMGDHSKCSINSMFNTGTIVGVSANVFGSGFPPKYVPSFSWGGANGFGSYQLEKMFAVAGLVMSRRGVVLTNEDKTILAAIFDQTAKNRS